MSLVSLLMCLSFLYVTVCLDDSFNLIRELARSITTVLTLHNAQPSRCAWSTKGEDILRKTPRARKVGCIPV